MGCIEIAAIDMGLGGNKEHWGKWEELLRAANSIPAIMLNRDVLLSYFY